MSLYSKPTRCARLLFAVVSALVLCTPATAALYGDFPELNRYGNPTGGFFRNVRDAAGRFGVASSKHGRLALAASDGGFAVECASCDPAGRLVADTLTLDFFSPHSGLDRLEFSHALDYRIESAGDQSYASFLATTNVTVRLHGLNAPGDDPIEAVFAMYHSPSNNHAVFGDASAEGVVRGELEADLSTVALRSGADLTRRLDFVTIELTTTLQVFHAGESGFARIAPAPTPAGSFLEISREIGVCLSCEPVKPPPSVPEPATGALIGLGLLGLASSRFRA